MKLSKKSIYGLKACYELAIKDSDERISLASLTDATGTTVNYLEQIMILLKREGIVMASRGSQGGYYLAAKPQDISVGKVLRALEDGLKIVDCIDGACTEEKPCAAHSVWIKMSNSINNMLDNYTLEDMIRDTKE